MEDAALFPELERRPLLFALWFRVLVVTLAAALMGALTIPPVLRWAGGAVTEPTVIREVPTADQPPSVDVAHSASRSWMLTSLGLVGGVGLVWVAREVLPRWRRHGDVRATPATGGAARPVAAARQPGGGPAPVAARQLLREIESSLHQLEQLHSQLLEEVQSDLRRSPELVA